MRDIAFIFTTLLLISVKMAVRSFQLSHLPFNSIRRFGLSRVHPLTNMAIHQLNLHPSMSRKYCYINNILTECPNNIDDFSNNKLRNIVSNIVQPHFDHINADFEKIDQITSKARLPLLRRMINHGALSNLNLLSSHGKYIGYAPTESIERSTTKREILNTNLIFTSKPFVSTVPELESKTLPSSTLGSRNSPEANKMTTAFLLSEFGTLEFKNLSIQEKFARSLDKFERKFYLTTFSNLKSITPEPRRENGMSFVQSGLFLQLALMALSTEVGTETKSEIDQCIGFRESDEDTIRLINETVSSLPTASENLKFSWFSRLVLRGPQVSEQFRKGPASALRLKIDSFNGTEKPMEMAEVLNRMVEKDSGGAIHDTFEEDDLPQDTRAVLITTLYLRARWRSAPTLLNETRPFYDSPGAPQRPVRMIRLNDIMRYADLTEYDAEALEIFYSTRGLSLLMLIPRSRSLKNLAEKITTISLNSITERMQPVRVAATLPLYTLRMTLLLPNKLDAMGVSRLVQTDNSTDDASLRLSVAVQRIMFWAEAGRNAFKDDGIEWDETPELQMVVDRPYIFYVRWMNATLMNGNFVL